MTKSPTVAHIWITGPLQRRADCAQWCIGDANVGIASDGSRSRGGGRSGGQTLVHGELCDAESRSAGRGARDGQRQAAQVEMEEMTGT